MNKFIKAVLSLDYNLVEQFIKKDPKWIRWSERSGKNALHYLCNIDVSRDAIKAAASLQIMKLLLNFGMEINSVHNIPEKDCNFPATPLWYAYTKGRNKKLYAWLLKNGANPDHCMFAIAWYDDVKAAALFKSYGAKIENAAFLAAFYWKKYQIAEWFLKNGADVNYIGEEGYSALLLAVKRQDNLQQIKLLLSHGARTNKENKEGLSPKKLAEMNRQKMILDLFNSWQKDHRQRN